MKKMGRMLVSVGTILILMGGLVTAVEELGQELITNGDMEKDSSWASYNCGSPLVPKVNEISFTEKHNGKASRHVVIVRGARQWPGIQSNLFSTTVTGKTYRVNFWIKVVKGGAGCKTRNGASNDYINLGSGINNPDWTEYTFYYTERDGGNNACLCFAGSPGETEFYLDETEFYLDDVSVREGEENTETSTW